MVSTSRELMRAPDSSKLSTEIYWLQHFYGIATIISVGESHGAWAWPVDTKALVPVYPKSFRKAAARGSVLEQTENNSKGDHSPASRRCRVAQSAYAFLS